ncbi:MAG: hypothetical protein JXB47_01840 [Anaerolineae bacterium]|nr:hypothetical protein [Anaerolineae bacterium]
MATRRQNERRFEHWIDLPGGGRRYWIDRPGADFGFVRYVKIVDANESTLQFVQEVYDDSSELIEIHQKYPVDSGHRLVGEDKE